jgi:hypothetical protein
VATLVSVAVATPSRVSVATGISPAAVSNTRGPAPTRPAVATAVATVACPQNGTSTSGLK